MVHELKIKIPAIRIKITGGCNRSCFFCHEEGAMRDIESMKADELFDCIHVLMESLGISHVMITGGEPMLHPQLREIIAGINADTISLTTNGTKEQTDVWWEDLKTLGLSRVTISIHDIDPVDFLKLELRTHDLQWAKDSIQYQFRNLRTLCTTGIPTRVNVVVYNNYTATLQILNSLRAVQQEDKFEIRLLNNLHDIESSQSIITKLCENLKAEIVWMYQRAGSSNVTKYYRAIDGFQFSTKVAFPYFFAPVCEHCKIKDVCFEGFYGVRVEAREGRYFVRLCIYKQSPDILMPWMEFINSGLAEELRETFGN